MYKKSSWQGFEYPEFDVSRLIDGCPAEAAEELRLLDINMRERYGQQSLSGVYSHNISDEPFEAIEA